MNLKDENIKEIIFNNNNENYNESNDSNNNINKIEDTNNVDNKNEDETLENEDETLENEDETLENEDETLENEDETLENETKNQTDQSKLKENNNENIKSIIFSNNENFENIIFNNIGENDITKFISEGENIIVEQEVAIKNENILYKDDIVYLKELVNQLLSEYPVSVQDSKYIQKNVEDVAKKILDVKNLGVKKMNMLENGIEYSYINDVINDKFNNKKMDNWIIPIVLDKHKIYSKLKEENSHDENLEDSNIYFTETLENNLGIVEENQRTQMIDLWKINHEKVLNKISYQESLIQELNITKPYLINYKKNNSNINGYIRKPKDDTLVLRYYDLNNINWNTYKINNDYLFSKDIFDEIGKIKGIEDSVFLKGDEINILGFMVLGKNNDNDSNNVLTPKNYSNFLNKAYNKRGIITNIFSSGDSVIIECKNHNLKENEIIYIEDSNSYPVINNVFSKSVKIIDKDNIEISKNFTIIKPGNYGILYSYSKLKFDLYEIVKENNTIDSINIKFIESNYENKEENFSHNKIYLFDKININKNDYDKIIKKILPSINEIINYEMDKIKKSYTFEDINNIINNYSLNIDTLNIKQIDIIKNIFENNLNKLINEKDNKIIKLNLSKNSKKFFKQDTYFLSDKYITNKNVEKIYGKYIHFGKAEDNIGLRLKWIEKQKDNGKLYYLYYLIDNYITYKNIISQKYIDNKIKDLENIYDELEKNFKKEKSLMDKKNKSYKNSKYVINNQESDDKFKNLKLILLDNVKLDSLDCIFRKDSDCNSRLYIRLEESIKKIKDNLENFKVLKTYIKDEILIKNINEQIELLKNKFYSNIFNTNYIKKNKINNEENEYNNISENKKNIINDRLSILINLIYSIKNYELKLNYIYNLIDKDGIIIDNHIYSKKYNRKIDICSHYYYFKKINYANSPEEKIQLIDEMLSIYSDYGETEKNVHTCKVCGEFLSNNDYDDTEGFSDSGMIKRSREVWTVEKVEKNVENVDLLEELKISDLEDRKFKEILLKYGLSIDDIEDAISISTFIIKNLYTKAGVQLPNTTLINIIVDCMQKIKNIVPYSIYRIKKIKQLQEKGFSKINIEKIDAKDTFKQDYERYVKIKKSSIITSRFLIGVQTSIPPLVRSSKTTICPFYTFDGEEGLDYMTCVLDEMKVVLLKDKTKSLEILKVGIQEEYNEFKNLTHIKELIKDRKIYDLEVSKKKENYKFKLENEKNKNIISPVEIGNEYDNLIKDYKDIETLKKLKNILINRLNYLAYNIKNVVKDVIEKAQITDIYSGLVETSCCTENADQFLNYYYYIATESEYPIKKDIDESILIFNYYKYFINIGSIHKFLLYDKNKFSGIYNTAIVDNETNTSQYLMRSVFDIYVDTGIYKGTPREYIGNIDTQIDVKTGISRNEILSKEYTIEEYRSLLRSIESYNTKYFTDNKKTIFAKSELNKLKKTSDDKLDKEIHKLVKNISIVLNKDKKFMEKYIDLIRNFGIFKENNEELTTEKDKIKNRDLINKKKLDYIKKFYITKLKKYLSIIKNGKDRTNNNINLSFMGKESALSLEIQSDIYNEYKVLEPFLNEEIKKYFIDLELDYTNDEINSINGTDNLYDSKYEKIKVYSDFNFNDAANVLLHILITQLNKFIICEQKNNINKNIEISENEFNSNKIYNIDYKNNKCKYICNFIMILLDDLDIDNELFNLCSDGSEKIKNSLIHDKIEYKMKQYVKEDVDYITTMMQSKMKTYVTSVDYLEEDLEEQQQEINEEDHYQQKIDFIMEKGKKELTEKYGYVPTDDQLESYKEDYIKNVQDDIMFEEEIYDFNNAPKGQEVIDQGADYGGFNEYDFETGDGFDYSEEAYE
jgi:hypothetical protein